MTGKVEDWGKCQAERLCQELFHAGCLFSQQKKVPAFLLPTWGDITFSSEGQGHTKTFGEPSSPSLDCVSQPERTTTPKQEHVYTTHGFANGAFFTFAALD